MPPVNLLGFTSQPGHVQVGHDYEGLYRMAISRRQFCGSGVGVTAGLLGEQALATPVKQASESYPSFDQLSSQFAEPEVALRLAVEVLAEVGEAFDVGMGPTGGRRVVPIVGGRFRGDALSGVVLPGGADRQTVRRDGIKELDATYELRADDGTTIMVRNRAIIDAESPPEGERRYVRSVVKLSVPDGPHAWLNRRLIIGTLHSMRPERPLVLLRFYIVE